eukprot:1992229-Rhodomonas_salina.1
MPEVSPRALSMAPTRALGQSWVLHLAPRSAARGLLSPAEIALRSVSGIARVAVSLALMLNGPDKCRGPVPGIALCVASPRRSRIPAKRYIRRSKGCINRVEHKAQS